MFLQRLYEDIPTVTRINSKPEIFLQNIRVFMCATKQVKHEIPKSWLPSHSSLQSYTNLFYKFVTYYMFDDSYNIDTWNIKKQVTG